MEVAQIRVNGVPETKIDTPAAAAPGAPSEPKNPSPAEDPSLASRIAIIAKKEKAFQAKQAKAQAEFEARVKDFEAKLEAFRPLQEKLAKFDEDPLPFLQDRGWTYDRLSQRVLNDNKPTAEDQILSTRKEVEQLRNQLSEKEKSEAQKLKEAEEARQRQVVEDFKNEIKQTVTGKADAYEFVNIFENYDAIYQKIEEHYQQTAEEGEPRILSVEEAADLVEQDLTKKYLDKLAASKKFGAKMAPPVEQPDGKDGPRVPSQTSKTPTPTLNNQVTASSAASVLPARTERERLQRALAALDKR